MSDDSISFGPQDDARDAVKTFERYDLVSAPVVDERGKLVGRLTVDAAMDFLRDESNLQALKNAGLSGDEDLFAAPWNSARNRWPWLAVNLLTAFIASRVIGQFEGTIERVAALAALMPIVASIGGNTGNQTMALVIRALAVDRLQPGNARRLMHKELAIGVMNGTVWGLIVGLFAVGLYANLSARHRDEWRSRTEPARGGPGRCHDSARSSCGRPGSRTRLERAADVHHRCNGLFPFSGPGDGVPLVDAATRIHVRVNGVAASWTRF